jgi:hypothetical protein
MWITTMDILTFSIKYTDHQNTMKMEKSFWSLLNADRLVWSWFKPCGSEITRSVARFKTTMHFGHVTQGYTTLFSTARYCIHRGPQITISAT